MNSEQMGMAIQNTNSNKMSVSEIIFGSIMATAAIYATWCAVSLIILFAS